MLKHPSHLVNFSLPIVFFVFQRFATEDHLNTHKLKHNMSLTLSAGGKFSSAIFAGLSFLWFISVYFVPVFLLKEKSFKSS